MNVVRVTFTGGALDLTAIDCRPETPADGSRRDYKNLSAETAVQLMDEFFAAVAPPAPLRLPPLRPTADFQCGDQVNFVSAKKLRNPRLLEHLGETAVVQWVNDWEIRIVFDDRAGFKVRPHHLERAGG